jgi:hypothetical protein
MLLGIVVLGVVVVVVVALSRSGPDKKEAVAEEEQTAPRALPNLAEAKSPAAPPSPRPPANCEPLADGGFSCGACRDDSDCPKKQGCFVNVATGRTECQGSECAKDSDCPSQMFCRMVGRTPRGDPMRGCVSSGSRQEGSACDPDNGSDPSVSCSGKLLCINGGCASPCEPPDYPERSNCPGELRCVTTQDGSGCTPACKEQQRATGKDPCTGGRVCEFLSVENATSLCVYKLGTNCLGSKGGCPEGTECLAETNARTERTTFVCHPKCDPATPSCPLDHICVPGKPNSRNNHCRRQCSPLKASNCSQDERCRRVLGKLDIWYCSAT